jgi:hypothetical protein
MPTPQQPEKQPMDTIAPLASIGIDIGKDVFPVVGFGTRRQPPEGLYEVS